jgi:hypothetical protein
MISQSVNWYLESFTDKATQERSDIGQMMNHRGFDTLSGVAGHRGVKGRSRSGAQLD